MDVRHFPDAQAALEVVAEPLGAAGAEGELSLGLLRRLVDTPGAFGSEVTMIAGEQDGRPIVFVLMTGDHPAQVAGFADPGEIGFGGLVAAMLDAGRRPPGVNGARHVSEPFARAWSDVAGAQVAVHRDLHAFERAVVAELSQRELDAGQSWCSQFTDAANPTSNRITEIGYPPRCDFRYLTHLVTVRRYSA